MDKPITEKKRKSLIDRLELYTMGKGKDVPVELKKKRPLMERFNEVINEKYDKWNDDLEIEK